MTGRLHSQARWKQLTELFDATVELGPEERARVIDSQCGNDTDLREELERLLAADADAESSAALDTSGAERVREQLAGVLRDSDSMATGQRFGAWRTEHLLGRGGMGFVFLAARDDGQFDQQAALKVLRPGLVDDLTRRRFLEERRVLAGLTHPGIAQLFDGGLGADGQPWYAMEYVDGTPITEWCDARKLGLAARIDLLGEVCTAVAYAHQHLVIHRDLKPANILVAVSGKPKLLDFGIAKLIPRADALTRSDTRLMTPEYAAPEQLRGHTVGTATDVYALGAIAFELFAGQRAFADALADRAAPSVLRACSGDDAAMRKRASNRGLSPELLRRQLRGDLERILRRALDPDPSRRYQTADALAQDLQRHRQGLPISLRRDRRYRLGKFMRRHRLGVAATAFGLALLACAFALTLRQTRQARDQARNATAVKDFMVTVFANADPHKHPGKPPDARELLDAGAKRLTGEFNDQPQIQAELLGALARSYAGIGDYAKAQPLAERALQAIVALHGADSDAALAARIDYAELLVRAGRGKLALAQAGQVLGATDDRVSEASVRAHLVMASSNDQLSNFKGFVEQAKVALDQSLQLGANGNHWQALAWYLVAQSHLAQRDFKGAQQALRSAIKLFGQSPQTSVAEAMDAQTNLIFLLLHSGHADEALAMYATLLKQQRQVLGESHPDYAESLSTYAYVLADTGHYQQARQASLQARHAMDNVTAMPVIQRDRSIGLLVNVAESVGNLQLAQQLMTTKRKLLQSPDAGLRTQRQNQKWQQTILAAMRGDSRSVDMLQQLHHDQPHARMIGFNADLAVAYVALGQYQEALDLYHAPKAAMQGASASASTRAHKRKDLMLNEGVALTELGQYTLAQKDLAAALLAYGTDPSNLRAVDSTHFWLAWLQVRSDHAAQALPAIDASLAWRQAQYGEDSYFTGEDHLARAEALAQLGRHDEALREQALARATLAAQLLPTHALLKRALLSLPSRQAP